jgi:RimJ/RimL family protein N-acetyltransferase
VASLPRRPRLETLLLPALRALRGGPALERPVFASERRTARLLLRPYRVTDELDWRRIEADDRIRSRLGWPHRTVAQARQHLHDRTRHTVLQVPGDLLVLAMEREGRVIGDVSLHLRTTAAETRTAEIGWLQLTSACGRGYATEAATAMLDLAFGELGACLVTAVIDRTNAESAQLALRLGFSPAGGAGAAVTFVLTACAHRVSPDRAPAPSTTR